SSRRRCAASSSTRRRGWRSSAATPRSASAWPRPPRSPCEPAPAAAALRLGADERRLEPGQPLRDLAEAIGPRAHEQARPGVEADALLELLRRDHLHDQGLERLHAGGARLARQDRRLAEHLAGPEPAQLDLLAVDGLEHAAGARHDDVGGVADL